MILIRMITGEEFILDEEYSFGNAQGTISLDPNKIHKLYYRYTTMSEEYKQQLGIEEVPNKQNKVIEFGFTPMNTDPHPMEEFILFVNNIAYMGKIKDSGLMKMFIKYREEFNNNA